MRHILLRLLLLSLLLGHTARAEENPTVFPRMDGIEVDADGTLWAWFGYENTGGEPRIIQYSINNFFIPEPSTRRVAPIRFAPGRHHRVFRTPMDPVEGVTWRLLGRDAIASPSIIAPPLLPFTFQGEIRRDGNRLDGEVSLRVTFWDAPSHGERLGTPRLFDGNSSPRVAVQNGLFSLALVPPSSIGLDGLWLEIEVWDPAVAGFVTLGDRQPVHSTPRATFSARTRGILVHPNLVVFGDRDTLSTGHQAVRIANLPEGFSLGSGTGSTRSSGEGNAWQIQVRNDRVGILRIPTTHTLEVAGEASKNTAGAWLAHADERIKREVQPLENALGRIQQIRPVRFRYTQEHLARTGWTIHDREYVNVIAQEFANVFPEHVQSSADLHQGQALLQVDTHPLTLYSVAAIQEIAAALEALRAENAALRSRLETLEARSAVTP